jgi:osmotically-inducible protein OsmY
MNGWSDERIRDEALERIRHGARVPVGQIGVAVSNGRVILSGCVASPVKRWAAGEAVLRVPGVVTVLNELVYPRSAGEAQLEQVVAPGGHVQI